MLRRVDDAATRRRARWRGCRHGTSGGATGVSRRGSPSRPRRQPLPQPAAEDRGVRTDARRAAAGAAPRDRLAVSTAIFGSRPALSRVLGLVREMVASYYFGVARADQRVHGRVPGPEPRAGARRRRRALVGVRAGLQRPAREGRATARLARRVEPLLADAARPDGADGALHPGRAVGDRPLRQPGQRPRLAVGLSRVLFPIVALLGVSGIVVGILNSYDHFTVPALSPVFWNLAIIVGLVDRRPARERATTRSSTSTRRRSSSRR